MKEKQAKGTLVEPSFTLGTMYWQNPKKGRIEVEEDLRQIRDNHFTMIRKFIWWEKVERKEGQFNFRDHDILYEAADKVGLKVMETYGFYLPHWLKIRLAGQGIEDRDRYYCLDRPEVAEPMERFIQAVVTRYRSAPALQIWNVWNEPTKPPCHCDHTRRKFIIWLKNKYKSVEALHAAWRGEYQVFETLYPDSLEELDLEWIDAAFRFGLRGRNTPMDYDWHQFSTVNLTENVKWLADLTRNLDPEHETHANPNCPAGNGVMDGQDVYGQAQVLDSISESIHPSHHFYNEADPRNYPVTQSFSVDKIRSWGSAHGKDAWIGEQQAGTTFYHKTHYTPAAWEISHALWHALGKGIKGLLFWEWQAWRSSMMEVAEFSLRRSADGGPTERSIAAGEFGRILAETVHIFNQVQRPGSRIALFNSLDASCYKALQKRGKPFLEELEHEHTFALYGCYKALSRANLPVDFVNEAMIAGGCLEKYEVLYMPHVELVSPGTADSLKTFVRDGGHLWADGRCGFLDEHVYLRDRIPGNGLDEVFGCEEADFVALAASTGIQTDKGDELRAYRFAQYLEPAAGSIWAEFPGGQPAIVSNQYGKGRAELVGTCLSLGLRNEDHPETMDYVAGFALEAGVRARIEASPVGRFELSRLSGDHHDVLIVTNRTDTPEAGCFRSSEPYLFVECPMDVEATTRHECGEIVRRFKPHETAVFICAK